MYSHEEDWVGGWEVDPKWTNQKHGGKAKKDNWPNERIPIDSSSSASGQAPKSSGRGSPKSSPRLVGPGKTGLIPRDDKMRWMS